MLMILSMLLDALDAVVGARAQPRPVQPVGDRPVEDLVDQGGLARARDAGDAAEHAEREADVDVLEVVLARAANHELVAGRPPLLRHRDRPLAAQVLAGEGLRSSRELRRRALRDDLAAVLAGAGAEVDDVVGGADRALVVLDHDHRVAEVAQPLERVDQLLVVALVEADRRLVEDVEDADERRADLGGEPDPLRLAAGERRRPPARATGSRSRRCRGSAAARRSRARPAARSRARSRSAPAPRSTRGRRAPTAACTRRC